MLTFLTKSRIEYYTNKNKYNSVMKQLKSYCIYNKNKIFIRFEKDSIIG